MSAESDVESIKPIIMGFSIKDLKIVLGSIGRGMNGRKHEMVSKILNLLRYMDSPVLQKMLRDKIYELSSRSLRQPCSNSSVTSSGRSGSGGISPITLPPPLPPLPPIPEATLPIRLQDSLAYNHVPASNNQTYPVYQPSTVGQSSLSLAERQHNPATVQRLCPLPFYETMEVLLKPLCINVLPTSSNQVATLHFNISLAHREMIRRSRRCRPDSTFSYEVQVLLRTCIIDPDSVQEDSYPPQCKLVVNKKTVVLPGTPPPNSQNMEPRKPHRPIDITEFCNLNDSATNHICLNWTVVCSGQFYTATIILAKIVSASRLLQVLTQRPQLSSDATRAMIMDRFRVDPECEVVAATSLKVSLCCPIGRMRMQHPCRPTSCKHFQCFDASCYLQLNERKPTWICPICDERAPFDSLYIDSLFSVVLAMTGKDESEVTFYEDGSWVLCGMERDSKAHLLPLAVQQFQKSAQSTPSQLPLRTNSPVCLPSSCRQTEFFTAESSVHRDAAQQCRYSGLGPSVSTPVSNHNGSRTSKSPIAVIDLTESDDEETPLSSPTHLDPQRNAIKTVPLLVTKSSSRDMYPSYGDERWRSTELCHETMCPRSVSTVGPAQTSSRNTTMETQGPSVGIPAVPIYSTYAGMFDPSSLVQHEVASGMFPRYYYSGQAWSNGPFIAHHTPSADPSQNAAAVIARPQSNYSLALEDDEVVLLD